MSENSLPTTLATYPKILSHITTDNNKLYKYVKICIINYILNILFSSILILYYYYDGVKSITTLITNVILQSGQIYSIYNISKNASTSDLIGLSCMQIEPICYNDVDKNYKKSSPEELISL